MALEGKSSDKPFNPELIEMLSEQLAVPGVDKPENEPEQVTDVQYKALYGLYHFGRNNPQAWNGIRRFLVEMSRNFADKCAGINPADDPYKRHGLQCFNAGKAQALVEAAKALDLGVLGARLRRLHDGGRAQVTDFS